jgi:hypothetical protein
MFGGRNRALVVFFAAAFSVLVLITFIFNAPDDSALVSDFVSQSLDANIELNEPVKGWENVTDLIMVAGHTIFIGSDYGESSIDQSNW